MCVCTYVCISSAVGSLGKSVGGTQDQGQVALRGYDGQSDGRTDGCGGGG